MSVSDYIKKYFEPTSDGIRVRDIVRESVTSAPVSVSRGIGQGALRGFAAAGTGLYDLGAKILGTVFPSSKQELVRNRPVLTPSTYFQRELYGTDKPITPKAAVDTTKNIAQGVTRTVASVGITAGNVPTQMVNRAIPSLKQPLPFDSSIQTNNNPFSNAVFGGQPVKTLQQSSADVKQFLEPYIGERGAGLSAYPLVGLGVALDLSGFGGGKSIKTGVKTFVEGEVPEAFWKFIASTRNKTVLENAFKDIGVKDLSTVDDLVRASIPASTSEEAKIAINTAWANRVKKLGTSTIATQAQAAAERKTKGLAPIVPEKSLATKEAVAKGVERKFITSVKEALLKLKGKVAGQYIPRSTDDLAIMAKNFIKDDLLGAERKALTETGEDAVAIASELIKKYGDDAARATDPTQANMLYDKAAEIANTLAPKLTEQGRAIQAASILGRMTPEGQVRFAAREIQKFNETAKIKIPELSGEQTKSIVEEMKVISDMPDGIEKAMRFQKLQNTIQDLVPTPLIKKVIAVWKSGLLTGIKTQTLNLFSNLSHATLEVVKDIPAAAVDSVASLFTGQRTKTFTTRGIISGVKEGFAKGLRYLKTGFDERNIGAKLDYKRVNFGKGLVAKAFQTYTDTVFKILGAADQPSYYGALSHSLKDQAFAQGKNAGLKGKELLTFAEEIVSSPTEQMIRYAVADATTAVFQNKTTLGEAAKKIQSIPYVGEIIVPFGRTPSSVAMQIINYSPVGIVKTIIENIGRGKFDQRLFSQGLGRGITGIAILAIGTALAKGGLIALDYPQGDEREQELQKAEGVKNNAIKIGDKWRSPTVLGPAGNILLVGAHFKKALEESGSPTEALSMATLGSAKSFTEQTFLTGIQNAVNAVIDPERYAKSYLPNLIASFVPTIVSDTARATDPLERRPQTITERIQARIPVARRGLEPQVDVLGREKERVGNPLEVLADPTRPSKDTSTFVSKELRRLMDNGKRVSPTVLGDRNGFKALSQEENTRLWKFTGEIVSDKLGSLFSREDYQSKEDDQKEKIVEYIIKQAQINSRAAMAIELTDGLQGEELRAKLSKLKDGELITREVFKKYLELR